MADETKGGAAVPELPENIQRWTAKRRAALVLAILRGETSVQEAARAHDLTVPELEEWKERFLLAAENALRSRPKDEEALKHQQIKKLERKVGQLVMDMEILREANKLRPFAPETSDERGKPCLRRRSAGFAGCWA